jgi:hypothetical protein
MKPEFLALVGALCLALVSVGCADLPTQVGAVCQGDDHCGGTEGNLALQCDNSIPGGSCTVDACISDDPATEEAEDATSCPPGSRCVRECPAGVSCNSIEAQTRWVCRQECGQQSDCHEIIVCGRVCEPTEGGGEECHEECANEMECTPFWDLTAEELKDLAEAPRACILNKRHYKGS